MKSKHTSGPWYYEGANIRSEEGLDVAHVDTERSTSRSQCDPIPEAEWIANTDLIAAAPDLLTELKGLLEVFTAYIETEDVANADIVETVRDARAAIAKAEGREE